MNPTDTTERPSPSQGASSARVEDSEDAAEETSWTAGHFTEPARRDALAAALPLLGTYFEAGARRLQAGRGPSRGEDPETDLLLAALRLRVALAATDTLIVLAEDIARRPNFRYHRRRTDTVGEVRGRLDTTRYATGIGRLQIPPRYPVTEVVRTQATPENTLLVCAAHWLLAELVQPELLASLPDGPERRQAAAAAGATRRVLSNPLFAVCRFDALNVMRLRGLRGLLDRVDHRLTSGRIAGPDPYRELVHWLRECLSGQPAARAGDLDWSFYGSAFDSKLFEIWCLSHLARSVGEALGERPPVPDLTRRGAEAMYRWETPLGVLEIHFQRSPSAQGRPQVWRRRDGGRGLAGIPDITVVGRPNEEEARLVLLDPKLRRRETVAADELFKMLGYFEQYGERADGRGAIVLYGGDDRATLYDSDGTGRLLEVTVDPSRGDGGESVAWTALCRLALDAISLGALVGPVRGPGTVEHADGSDEAVADA